jgi:hypothetical protein
MLRGLVSVTDLLDRRNFNSAREVNSRNNPHIPYPGAEDVFMRLRSVSAHEDEDFADLRLVDSLDAFRESARAVQGRVMRDDVSSWDRGMLNRGLVPDPLEHSSPTRDLCLGYAASIGVMACNHIGGLGDQVADDLQRIFVALLIIGFLVLSSAESSGFVGGTVGGCGEEVRERGSGEPSSS